MDRLKGIDILRAFAVFLVMGRHMSPCPADANSTIHALTQLWFRGGWIGVDLFFVLSGFLVSGLLFREHEKFGSIHAKHFLLRRGFKIYPAFWLLIACSYVFFMLQKHPVELNQILFELLFVQNYKRGVWGHTWSLAVEEHFYFLLTALMFILTARRASANRFKIIPLLFLIVGLVCLALRLAVASGNPFNYYTYLYPSHLRLDSLSFGVFISYLYHQYPTRFFAWAMRHRLSLLIGGILLLTPAFVLTLEGTKFLHTFGLTVLYIGSGLLLIGVLAINLPTNSITNFGAYIGSHSYSIYLWHVPVVVWVVPLVAKILGSHWNWPLYCASYFLGSLGIGILMALLIEFPVLRVRDRLLPSRARALETHEISTDRMVPRFVSGSFIRTHRINLSGALARTIVTARRLTRRIAAKRKIFIDCGSNTCRVLEARILKGTEREFFAFEPQPELSTCAEEMRRKYPSVPIHFFGKAVWVYDGSINLYLATNWGPNHKGGSTLLAGHVKNESQVDYSHPIRVECIDFSEWIRRHFSKRDHIVVKMDVEGAEYPILEKMVADASIDYVSELLVEFHWQMNESITKARHDSLRKALEGRVSVQEWQ